MRYLLLFCLLAFACGARAQAATDSVKAVIGNLFEAMHKSDSTAIVSCFAPGGMLQSVDERTAEVKVRTDSASAFAHIIASLPPGSVDEKPRLDVVRVDGNLAVVWAPYNLYFHGNFYHCGVDSFQLVRLGGKWQIQYVIDTEHKQGCTP
jgi:hypothetical protein